MAFLLLLLILTLTFDLYLQNSILVFCHEVHYMNYRFEYENPDKINYSCWNMMIDHISVNSLYIITSVAIVTKKIHKAGFLK